MQATSNVDALQTPRISTVLLPSFGTKAGTRLNDYFLYKRNQTRYFCKIICDTRLLILNVFILSAPQRLLFIFVQSGEWGEVQKSAQKLWRKQVKVLPIEKSCCLRLLYLHTERRFDIFVSLQTFAYPWQIKPFQFRILIEIIKTQRRFTDEDKTTKKIKICFELFFYFTQFLSDCFRI